MTMNPCTINVTEAECKAWYEDVYDVHLQNELDAPKPWIGMYIAAASAVCGIATMVDVFNGFKTKQIWLPCKYFSLNATSLTLLAIAMKLTMDLTSTKLGFTDTIAGYSSVVLMCNATGNFMTSLAAMDDNEIMLNLTALGILVITIDINVWVFNVQLNRAYGGFELYFDDFVGAFILLLLVLLCTSAIIVPTTKRYVETQFAEMHKMVLNERLCGAKFTAQELTAILTKYWIMAGTGNPQFVMARSVICVIPGLVCLSMTVALLVLVAVELDSDFFHSDSIYKWSVSWILIIQVMGAVIGSIAPTSRLIVAARFRSSRAGHRSFKEEMKTETYWTQRLIDWRERPMPLRIRHFKCKKILHSSKRMCLNICIKIQIMIVLTSKLILFPLSWLLNMTLNFIHNADKLRRYVFKFTSERREHESRAAIINELDFSLYVLLLEGEFELPKKIIDNISSEADKLIEVGKKRKPKNIIELLQKSESFNGVLEFDRKIITSLHVQEPRNCWSLSLVTLTSIAVALPNISSHIVRKLFSRVSESLPFVKFIEKFFDASGELISVRKTADIIWVRLELDQKWQDRDVVQGNNLNDQAYKDTLFALSTKAKGTIMKFKTSMTDSVMNNPLNWPAGVIAANSMYRVCESLLLSEKDGINGQIFERLTIIISDILAACLTNLAHVIFTNCHIKPVEKRQESIQHALVLLGESEEIIQCLEKREWPNMDPDKSGYIEEWRAILEHYNEDPVNSVSTIDGSSIPQSSNEHVIVRVET